MKQKPEKCLPLKGTAQRLILNLGLISCFLLAFLFVSATSNAETAPADAATAEAIDALQAKTLSGKVTGTDGEPIPGVSILVKGTTVGTITNFDGEYSLDVPAQAETIIVSFVGMVTQEITIGNQSTINVVMQEDVLGLEEVVVVGYGTQYKREISGSISNVSEKDFNKGGEQHRR